MKVIYTNAIFWVAGITVCQHLILINPKYKEDAALLAHEMTHVKQMGANGTFIWWMKYLLSRSFRKDMEVEAYKVQIDKGLSIDLAAFFLSTMYYLNITIDEAKLLLAKG